MLTGYLVGIVSFTIILTCIAIKGILVVYGRHLSKKFDLLWKKEYLESTTDIKENPLYESVEKEFVNPLYGSCLKILSIK